MEGERCREAERGRNKLGGSDIEIFLLLVNSQKACNSQGCAKLEPGVRTPLGSLKWA